MDFSGIDAKPRSNFSAIWLAKYGVGIVHGNVVRINSVKPLVVGVQQVIFYEEKRVIFKLFQQRLVPGLRHSFVLHLPEGYTMVGKNRSTSRFTQS